MASREAILIFGPTASGKSDTAKQIADKINSVIINADSLQVYKDLRVLTSRPTLNDEALLPHKIYGHISGNIQYSVADWLIEVSKEVENAFKQNLIPILVGGTGLYFKSLIDGLANIPDIEQSRIEQTKKEFNKYGLSYLFNEITNYNRECAIDEKDVYRIIRAYNILKQTGKSIEEWQSETHSRINNIFFHKLLINPSRDELYKKSDARFDEMIRHGAIEEVENLNQQNYRTDSTIMKAIGVREISQFFSGLINKDEAVALAKQKTRNYIKRQQTWINSNNITWNSSLKKLMRSL